MTTTATPNGHDNKPERVLYVAFEPHERGWAKIPIQDGPAGTFKQKVAVFPTRKRAERKQAENLAVEQKEIHRAESAIQPA